MEEKTDFTPTVPALVSIITPCWNSEKFVHRLLDSVLAQDYPAIEMIIVNDGSTDGTARVLASYEEKFRSRGFSLKTFFQENAGQAAALDFGLKKFAGEFLVWTDSDDYFLRENAISTFVDFLRKNPDCGFVACNCARERTNGKIDRCGPFVEIEKTPQNIFERLLKQRIFFVPGRIMVRTETFLQANPMRSIFHSRQGQNFQMEFPIAYVAKCGFIAEELYCYVERFDSHSHSTPTDLARINGLARVVSETLARIDMPCAERERYLRINARIAARKRLRFYFAGYFRELVQMHRAGTLRIADFLVAPYAVARAALSRFTRRFRKKIRPSAR